MAILLAVVIIIAGASIGYGLSRQHSKVPAKKTFSATRVAPSKTTRSTATINYVSNGKDLNLNFGYPASWSVAPASNNNPNDQTITLNSPLTTILDAATGKAVTGKVTVNIRPGSAQLNELNSGTATAGQASVQYAYNKPTANQYQYAYLTYVHLLSTRNPSGVFEEVLVTGSTQFTQGETVTSANVSVDPIISAEFYSCSTNACTGSGASPLSITNNTWQSTPVFQQTLALFESLQLN